MFFLLIMFIRSYSLMQVAILSMFTLITLYSPIIPISLYVSIEVGFIIQKTGFVFLISHVIYICYSSLLFFQMIKFIQSTQFINKDLHMFHTESNTPALARTSNLNEELGQVVVLLIFVWFRFYILSFIDGFMFYVQFGL